MSIAQPSREPRARGAFLSAGFRPFFLLAAVWAALAMPVWLAAFVHGYALPAALPAVHWHAHEMVFGYGMAALAGFLLTAIPNWTGRLPVRGAGLAALAGLWLAGRIAVLAGGLLGPAATAVIDLAFPAALIAAVARELIAGRNWRNLPMIGALCVLFTANLLVHLGFAPLGLRLGIATLLALLALVGGRIVPSFTRNWLARLRPGVRAPASPDRLDLACLLVVVIGLVAWAIGESTPILQLFAGLAAALRLARWRGLATWREPLLLVLHAGYAWLALGLAFLGLNGLFGWTAPGAPLHALTVGAIGTMTLAVMTRASLGHSGRELRAGAGTVAVYALVTAAALLRIAAPLAAKHFMLLTSAAGIAWSGAFALFAILYGPLLLGKDQ